jgi:hypothetical protein
MSLTAKSWNQDHSKELNRILLEAKESGYEVQGSKDLKRTSAIFNDFKPNTINGKIKKHKKELKFSGFFIFEI